VINRQDDPLKNDSMRTTIYRKNFFGILRCKSLLLLSLFLSITFLAQAKVFRLGFNHYYYSGKTIPGVDFNFNDYQSLYSAAKNGDTVQVYSLKGATSTLLSDFGTITKQLVWIYIGYLTSGTGSNKNLQVITDDPPSVFNISSDPGKSVFIGFNLKLQTTKCTGAIFRNCQVECLYQNTVLSGCKFSGCYNLQIYADTIGVNEGSNILIENSVIKSAYLKNRCRGIIRNCIVNVLDARGCAVEIDNNIFYRTASPPYGPSINVFYDSLSRFENNLFELPESSYSNMTGNNNLFAVNMDNVFVGGAYNAARLYSDDERFRLKGGSPGIGAGLDGVDVGIFGGSYPYRLSGMAPVPSTYKLGGSGQSKGNIFPFTFSARSN